MTPDPTFWAQWLKPSAGLDTLQWSLLLALAALVGYVFQRHLQMPKVLGYAVVGTLAGLSMYDPALDQPPAPGAAASELRITALRADGADLLRLNIRSASWHGRTLAT